MEYNHCTDRLRILSTLLDAFSGLDCIEGSHEIKVFLRERLGYSSANSDELVKKQRHPSVRAQSGLRMLKWGLKAEVDN